MHFHVELIMPPTPLIEVDKRVGRVLSPLQRMPGKYDWLYAWYRIGGRFAGDKLYLRLDPERLRQFRQELYSDAFTKGTDFEQIGLGLWSVDDIPKVDALWRKWFPEDEVGKYPGSPDYPAGDQDICRVDQIPDKLTAYAVVVANEDKVIFLRRADIYDSTKHEFQDTGFDGSVLTALRECRAEGFEPPPDWLVVTLDCHN